MNQKMPDKPDKYKNIEYATYTVYRFGKKVGYGMLEIKGGIIYLLRIEGTPPEGLSDAAKSGNMRHLVISEFEVWMNRNWLEDAAQGTSTNPFTRFEKHLYERKRRQGT